MSRPKLNVTFLRAFRGCLAGGRLRNFSPGKHDLQISRICDRIGRFSGVISGQEARNYPHKGETPNSLDPVERFYEPRTSYRTDFDMEGTTPSTIVQACTLMHAHLEAHCRAFMRVSASMTAAQHAEMVRAGSQMWALVAAVKADAMAQAAERDGGYQAFKAQLLAKPKRVRKSRKVAA